ncbi:hypothetical protein CVT24_000742 [Panaeolus cyanescens]|uniref:Uncharacterized protein n=1 Tax=Panaeolus cyanescens TaxID=181874 RepID=A0A409WPI7_9AGAR|nr:hypothetical protein CVT24_000742 [Panaeolus cyanescens]
MTPHSLRKAAIFEEQERRRSMAVEQASSTAEQQKEKEPQKEQEKEKESEEKRTEIEKDKEKDKEKEKGPDDAVEVASVLSDLSSASVESVDRGLAPHDDPEHDAGGDSTRRSLRPKPTKVVPPAEAKTSRVVYSNEHPLKTWLREQNAGSLPPEFLAKHKKCAPCERRQQSCIARAGTLKCEVCVQRKVPCPRAKIYLVSRLMEHLNVPQAEAEKVFDHHWGRGGGSKAKPTDSKKSEGAAGDESIMGSRAQTPALNASTASVSAAATPAAPVAASAATSSTPATNVPSNTTHSDTLPSISTARASTSKPMDPPRVVPARHQKSLHHESNKTGPECPTPVAQTSSGLGRITIPPKVTRSITTSSTTTTTEIHITRSQASSITASRREKALEQQLEDALNELGRERELIAHLRKRLNQEGHANATIAGNEQAKRETLSQGYRDQINALTTQHKALKDDLTRTLTLTYAVLTPISEEINRLKQSGADVARLDSIVGVYRTSVCKTFDQLLGTSTGVSAMSDLLGANPSSSAYATPVPEGAAINGDVTMMGAAALIAASAEEGREALELKRARESDARASKESADSERRSKRTRVA